MLHGGVSDERVDEILSFVSMEKAADKKVRAYSQGMRQRLGLARALLWKPKVLLLDDDTTSKVFEYADIKFFALFPTESRATPLKG